MAPPDDDVAEREAVPTVASVLAPLGRSRVYRRAVTSAISILALIDAIIPLVGDPLMPSEEDGKTQAPCVHYRCTRRSADGGVFRDGHRSVREPIFSH